MISTGMGNVDEIDLAVKETRKTGNNNFSLFQCTSLYPAPKDELNLNAIRWLNNRYDCNVGFSDHSIGTDAAFLAIGAGATLIEKHFSFDTSRSGFDHKISLDADGFKKMIERIRLAEEMLGSNKKIIPDSILSNRDIFLRSIVSISPINKGDIFTKENTGIKRTLANKRGAEPKYLKNILGQMACRDIELNEPIKIEDIT